MLTGDRMFGGDTVAETLASVIKDPITFAKLSGDTPVPIRRLVTRCLERDPRRRLQSIAEARIILEDVIAGTTGESELGPPPSSNPINRWPCGYCGNHCTGGHCRTGMGLDRPLPRRPRHAFHDRLHRSARRSRSTARTLPSRLSPDGRYVAIVADETGRQRTIWVRALDSLSAQRLDRTEGAKFPFWSPDSQHIAYFADGKLMRISMAGGAPLTICDAPDREGGAWFQSEGQDGVIVFAPNPEGPLQRVLAQGGVPTAATTLAEGETGHSFPQFLARRTFPLPGAWEQAGHLCSIPGTRERTFVVNSIGRAAFSPPGLLLYLRDATLLAHRWNLRHVAPGRRARVNRRRCPRRWRNGRNAFAISASGVLAYRGGGTGGRDADQLVIARR